MVRSHCNGVLTHQTRVVQSRSLSLMTLVQLPRAPAVEPKQEQRDDCADGTLFDERIHFSTCARVLSCGADRTSCQNRGRTQTCALDAFLRGFALKTTMYVSEFVHQCVGPPLHGVGCKDRADKMMKPIRYFKDTEFKKSSCCAWILMLDDSVSMRTAARDPK